MKGRVIALDHLNGREVAALIVDGRLEDLFVDKDDMPVPGTVYLARVDRPLKGQGGVMMALGPQTGFLRRAKGLAPGQTVLVQVSGYAEAGKAVPVTDRVLFKSRYAIVTPDAPGLNISRAIKDDDRRDVLQGIARGGMDGADAGLILRSACETADDEDILEDIEAMRSLCDQTLAHQELGLVHPGDGPHLRAWREWSAPASVNTQAGSLEDTGALDAIDALSRVDVPLGQGSMAIEPTRALIAVDVNTGADTSPAAALKVNLAALNDLPRQLRLRGLGGQITLDLAPVMKRDRRQIETAAKAAFRRDSVDTEIVGWTPLGHLELKRKRERRPLSEVLG
ncbi:ribonuclease E/G [Shimia ponticola]|uniref:ribonuclease E/G n=1 Tax=Shimia ponticola TaxID=2582893 RepID=UPI0011BE70D3|nr:ribonuclease E/G [Shimia ponticola]